MRDSYRGLALLSVLASATALAEPACPQATLTVFVDNRSGVSPLEIAVDGNLAPEAVTCTGSGATTYRTTLTCTGSGIVRCEPPIDGRQPGAWIHRLTVAVPGSEPQQQATRLVLVGGSPRAVSNALVWTVYPRTFVVKSVDNDAPDGLQLTLDGAARYTADHPDATALVTFSPDTFPGGPAEQPIYLVNPLTSPSCLVGPRNVCPATNPDLPNPTAGLCFTGDRIVVDGLDRDAQPGRVMLSVGTCGRPLLRLSGSDDTLRGIVFAGSQKANSPSQLDTIAITGAHAARNRIERSRVVGPTSGDAVSVEFGARDNVIVASDIAAAADKGVKVVDRGVVRIERSCVHDNSNGGVQLTTSAQQETQGGVATVIENVIQHNLGGEAQHGLFAGVEGKPIETALTTRGNVVRFNGADGIFAANAAITTLDDDVVTDNYRAGLRIWTTISGSAAPTGTVRGGLFACNFAPGFCVDPFNPTGPPTGVCREDADCPGDLDVCTCTGDVCDPSTCCPQTTAGRGAAGVGVDIAICRGCTVPTVDLGNRNDAGRNGFTLNANPKAATSPRPGINVSSRFLPTTTTMASVTSTTSTTTTTAPRPIPMSGNQWQDCAQRCGPDDVAALDVRIAPGATPVDVGTPSPSRGGPAPSVTAVSPPRARAGDFVRVYGGPFNVTDGTDCHPPGLLADPCSPANPNVVARNAADLANGNHVTVTVAGTAYEAAVHQVTPSMLVFAMPVDCYAPGTITVARGASVGAPAAICSPQDCDERPEGSPCDDGEPCTTGDRCDRNGRCAGTRDAEIPGCSTTTTTTATTMTSTTTASTIGTVTSTTLPCTTVRCTLESALSAGACADELVPRRLASRLERAVMLTEQAASRRGGAPRRLVGRASRLLSQISRAAKRATTGRRPRLSRACASQIQHAIAAVRRRLGIAPQSSRARALACVTAASAGPSTTRAARAARGRAVASSRR